jgi:hypothetical protein
MLSILCTLRKLRLQFENDGFTEPGFYAIDQWFVEWNVQEV